MANNQCIIDDEYCAAMGSYFKEQGAQLDKMISEYIAIMKLAQAFGTRSGEVHDAMGEYIECAEKLKGKFGPISKNAQSQINQFLKRVDEADQYLF